MYPQMTIINGKQTRGRMASLALEIFGKDLVGRLTWSTGQQIN